MPKHKIYKTNLSSSLKKLFTGLCRKLLSFFLGILFFLAPLSAAPEIQVSAELSRHRVTAGEMVQLDVKVTGAQDADVPHKIAVDGLQISLAGQSKQVEMVNFAVNSSALYSYIVIPLHAGTFTIPSIQVRADGKYFRTSPQQLIIEGSASSSGAAQAPLSPSAAGTPPSVAPALRSAPAPTNSQIAFSELIISKKKLYVGEVVPAEIRFYVDAHYNARPRRGIDFSNEGLLVERLSDPLSSREERNGILYNVATFRTFISAVKPGPLSVGPATLELAIELPTPTPTPADMPDLVAQLLGRSGPMTQQHSLALKSNKISLEVIPLPNEGRPDHFSGAIGTFQIDAMALPKKYSLGDPVTLAITIEGDGNFKAISMPQLTDTEGWKIYPSTDRIDAPDDAGLHGIKTFETSMIAQEPKTTTPGSLFSYFNPNTGKYVTLSTKPQPLQVIPSATASTTPAPTNTVAVSPSPVATPSPLQALSQHSMRSWQAPLYRTEYFLVSGALLCALLIFTTYLGFQWYQKTELLLQQQELKKRWSELQDDQLAADLFLKKAAAYAEILLKKDSSRSSELEEIFRRRDEINYGARETILRPQERQRILEKLSVFRTVHKS
ncbi:MAG: BatD family protein [Chthoniobacterales bacterium]